MNWRFWESEPQAVETRSEPYTDAIVQYLYNQSEENKGLGGRTAVEEALASLWARAFASAMVEPINRSTVALTPPVLESIGRELFQSGQAVFEITVTSGQVALIQAASWTVTGGERWLYELTIPQPSATVTRFRDADAVIHLRYGTDVRQPWSAAGPMQRANSSQTLNRNLEGRLSQEVAMPVGSVLPMPETGPATEKLQGDISGLTGQTVLVPSTADGWNEGQRGAPRSDWQPRRLGANPPATLEPIRQGVADHMAAAAGVPAALIRGDSEGTAKRESWRQFVRGTIQPVAAIIMGELRDKLNEPELTLKFDRLLAPDLSQRSRAFQSMVGGGMDTERAATLAGLTAGE